MMKTTLKNDIKLLALDLDGTTLTSRNTMSEKTRLAIESACENGLDIAVASGRPYYSMPREILKASGIKYIISSNGAAIHNAGGECVFRSLLSEYDVLKILELTADYDLIFEAFIDGRTYTDSRYVENPLKYGCGEAYVDYVRAAHGKIGDMRTFIFSHRTELDSIEIICTDHDLRKTLWKMIANAADSVFITSSSENFIEFMNAGATKSNALCFIGKSLGIKPQNICACGNADNDADMIKLAGLGAAVKNASALCLEYADVVVPSNDDDGVAELIDFLISK